MQSLTIHLRDLDRSRAKMLATVRSLPMTEGLSAEAAEDARLTRAQVDEAFARFLKLAVAAQVKSKAKKTDIFVGIWGDQIGFTIPSELVRFAGEAGLEIYVSVNE